jgi:hypothetical protein
MPRVPGERDRRRGVFSVACDPTAGIEENAMLRTIAIAAGLTLLAAAPALAHAYCPAGYYYSYRYQVCRLSTAYYYPPGGVVGGAVGTAGYVAGSAVNTAGAVAGAAVGTAGAIAGGTINALTGR